MFGTKKENLLKHMPEKYQGIFSGLFVRYMHYFEDVAGGDKFERELFAEKIFCFLAGWAHKEGCITLTPKAYKEYAKRYNASNNISKKVDFLFGKTIEEAHNFFISRLKETGIIPQDMSFS